VTGQGPQLLLSIPEEGEKMQTSEVKKRLCNRQRSVPAVACSSLQAVWQQSSTFFSLPFFSMAALFF